jgi:ABC-type iron transport system FetAB ATPase subunit
MTKDTNAEEDQCVEDTMAETMRSPMAEQMIRETTSYIEQWGMKIPNDNNSDHPINKEWKVLSGGESQRILLAIALASRPRVLLLDEASSGLDSVSERKVEESILGYVKNNDAAALWVTHSDDIADRVLL